MPAAAVDAVVTDPPYAEIDRDYGRLTEPAWHRLMGVVVAECRRLLTARGSAVFILQPNSERVGRVRPWLWEFMAAWARDWNMVQDAWWWNITAPPTVHTHRTRGLMRPSMKACVWLGAPDCHRNQDAVLWGESDSNRAMRLAGRASNELHRTPSGYSSRRGRSAVAAGERGGVTPFNVLPIPGRGAQAGPENAHGAQTPAAVADWWIRYLCPPGGTLLEPFAGTGTVNELAARRGCRTIGVEATPKYFDIAVGRMERALAAAGTEEPPAVAAPARRRIIGTPAAPRPALGLRSPRRAACARRPRSARSGTSRHVV